MNYFEALKYGIAQKPEIMTKPNNNYLIIGSYDHGFQIPQTEALTLIESLDGLEALKMEGTEETLNRFHPMSVEILTKASVDQMNFSWLPESDDEDMGQKLSKYGISQQLMEVYVPSLSIRLHRGIPEGFFQNLPRTFEYYKARFGFLNTEHAMETFLTVAQYWMEQKLNLIDLASFAYDFEMFMGNVREFEYWRPDLKKFRETYKGKIGVCVGAYHVPFVQSVLEGQEIEKPDWSNHIDRNNDPFVVERKDLLKGIYGHIETSLKALGH